MLVQLPPLTIEECPWVYGISGISLYRLPWHWRKPSGREREREREIEMEVVLIWAGSPYTRALCLEIPLEKNFQTTMMFMKV